MEAVETMEGVLMPLLIDGWRGGFLMIIPHALKNNEVTTAAESMVGPRCST